MTTPILDFVRRYSEDCVLRFHMPGHKGKAQLGPECWDITEVCGADSLYEAAGIIHESECNATELFGSQRTVYSTEGSSQCIRAMLHLLLCNRPKAAGKTILAARNVHKAFVYAAALLDFDVQWLYPEEYSSICSCTVRPETLDRVLSDMDVLPAAVYITSPDYLGNMADIAALSEICHRHGTYLAVDNAHGAYLHFLPEPKHPLDLGADICCDSAHKTLPVLTGGAYLHVGRNLPQVFSQRLKSAMALFGSTSPSYLTLSSLDACNAYISDAYTKKLADFVELIDNIKSTLRGRGWQLEESDPLRLCLKAPKAMTGMELHEQLRKNGIEAEYADRDYVVFMFTPQNDEAELKRLCNVLDGFVGEDRENVILELPKGDAVLSVREAIMANSEIVKVELALGRVCASPMVSCPPAIPIVVSGEIITEPAIKLLQYYNINEIEVVK